MQKRGRVGAACAAFEHCCDLPGPRKWDRDGAVSGSKRQGCTADEAGGGVVDPLLDLCTALRTAQTQTGSDRGTRDCE